MTFEERIRSHQKEGREENRWPEMTLGDLMDSVLEIHDPEQAKLFRDGYVEYIKAVRFGYEDEFNVGPEQTAAENIGWLFGEGMPQEDREIWRQLGCSHPVFGEMRVDPTPEEAFQAGYEMAKEMKAADWLEPSEYPPPEEKGG